MISRKTAYWATIAVIWALALWHSWTSRGLFVDGANFLVHVVRQEDFFDFYDPRRYAMVAGQIPIMIAVTLGSTDLQLLARDRKSTRLNSSHMSISYAVFCLK